MLCFYQKSDDKRTDGLVVRICGTTVNISREKEILSLQIAHAAGCFPAVLATFKNGLVYPYVQGRMATFTDLTQPPVIKELTRLIYNLQHTNPQELDLFDRQGNRTEFKKFETTLGPIKRCLARIPNKATDSAMDEVFQQIRKELTDDVLREEFGFLEKFYNGFPEPIVLCHNDLQPWNILINDETGELTILDYELTSRNLDMHDFARLWDKRIFYEVLGFCDKDEPVFNDDIKRLYFQGYLEAKRMNGGDDGGDTPDTDIELLDTQARILDIMYGICHIIIALSFVNSGQEGGLNWMKHLLVLKDEYFQNKDSLLTLQQHWFKLAGQYIEDWIKSPKFRKWHFQMHVLDRIPFRSSFQRNLVLGV